MNCCCCNRLRLGEEFPGGVFTEDWKTEWLCTGCNRDFLLANSPLILREWIRERRELRQLLQAFENSLPHSHIPLPPPGRLCFPKDTSAAIRYWVGDES